MNHSLLSSSMEIIAKGRRNMKLFGGKIKVVVLSLALLALILVFALAHLTFEPLPEDAQVRQIWTDQLGQYYLLTSEQKLYVGGWNGDRFGFYDTDFRWGTLYGFRNLFKISAPVLFAEDVSSIFPCENGLLYSDLNGALFYFGELNGGRLVKVSDNVLTASGSLSKIVYVDSTNTAYSIKWNSEGKSWTEPALVSQGVSDICIDGLYLRLLTLDGRVFEIFKTGAPPHESDNIIEIADSVERMWNGQGFAVLQKTDGSYLLVAQNDCVDPVIRELEGWNANSQDPDKVIVDADLKGPYPGKYLLSKQGSVYQLDSFSAVYVQSIEGKELAVHGQQKILYSIDADGKLQQCLISSS